MFTDMGFWEMAVIGVMALLVLGPERLPGAARSAGKWVGKARRMMGDMKRDIKAELDANELESLKDIGKDIKEAGESIKSQVSSADEKLQSGLKKETSAMDDAISDALDKESSASRPSNAVKTSKTTKASSEVKKATKKKVAKKKVIKKTVAKAVSKTAPVKSAKVTKKTATKKRVAKKVTTKAATKA